MGDNTKPIKQDMPPWVPIGLALLSVILFLRACEHQPGKPGAADTVVRERVVIVPPDTVTLVQYKPRIVYRDRLKTDTLTDTIYSSKPFFAYMDTTIGCSIIKVRYTFPENTFDSLHFVTCPDTIKVTDTTITNTITATGTFWDDLKNVGLGFIGGFVVGVTVAR